MNTLLFRQPQQKNRSRIDFFVVSCNILDSVTGLSNAGSLQNKLFDHRAVKLEFNIEPKVIIPPTISKSILKEPDTELVVGLAVAETYFMYSTVLSNQEKVRLSARLGQQC